MADYLINRLCEIGLSVYTDGFGNVYGEYGKSETYPAIVAHMDEVHKHKPDDLEIVSLHGNLFGFSETERNFVGIGADDKNGLWVALKVAKTFVKRKQPIKVAFFAAEEVGCVGSARCEISFFSDCRFVLQCDRKGSSDFINKANGLELNSKEFREATKAIRNRYGYKDACGMTTDVYELKMQGLDISVANISCGYYNPHTDRELTNVAELKNCLKMVLELMALKETYPHEAEIPIPKYPLFGYYDYRNYGQQNFGQQSFGQQNLGQQNANKTTETRFSYFDRYSDYD